MIFTTDHGIAFPRARSTLYDPGLEVALIMRLPAAWGRRVGAVLRPVSHVDVLPTVLERQGLDVPDRVQGRSFARVLRGEPDAGGAEVFGEENGHDIDHTLAGDERYAETGAVLDARRRERATRCSKARSGRPRGRSAPDPEEKSGGRAVCSTVMITAEETRVLGSLVEKQLATPQSYPLTENAVIAACNQATNRDPVVDYDRSTVRRALVGLREQGLARTVHRPGDRAAKHAHRLDEALGLDARELAVLALLLLRGPQTPGELRARAERLHPLDSTQAVQEALSGLSERAGGALVAPLERRAGQKEIRYTHLLTDEAPERAPDVPPVAPGPAAAAAPGDHGGLAATVARLVREVDRLRSEVAELRERLDASR